MVSLLVISAIVIIVIIILQYIMGRVYLSTDGKYILITGCDSGFGNRLARTLPQHRGCHVIAACLTEAAVIELNQVTARSEVTPIQMDVTSSQSIRQAYNEVLRIIPSGQGLWGVVNNAGINTPHGAYQWMSRQELSNMMEVNFLGTVDVTCTFLPLLLRARGRIVNMSSCTALLPSIESAYCASKVAVEAFSDNLRNSIRRLGVSVHIIQPGAFKTWISNPDNVVESYKTLWDRLPSEQQEQYGGIERFNREQYLIRKGLQMASPKLHQVTDAIEHALCSRYPWRRYIPGIDAKLFFKPMSLLPACVTDCLFDLV